MFLIHSYSIGIFTTWQTQALVCGLTSLALPVFVLGAPESLEYHVEQADFEKAGQPLSSLHGCGPVDTQENLNGVSFNVKIRRMV